MPWATYRTSNRQSSGSVRVVVRGLRLAVEDPVLADTATAAARAEIGYEDLVDR